MLRRAGRWGQRPRRAEGLRGPTPQLLQACPPESRLPVWEDRADGLRAKFLRMGFEDRELVALVGAHSVGHTHEERRCAGCRGGATLPPPLSRCGSGFVYASWDATPLLFDTGFFEFLLRDWWIYDDEDPEHPHYRNRQPAPGARRPPPEA